MEERLVNGYSGEYFAVWMPTGIITKTDTIPIWIQFVDDDGVTPAGDVAGDVIVLSFAPSVECLQSGQLTLEVEMQPVSPTTEAIFSGEISDDQTYSLPPGTLYASVAHIKADGRKYILDMAEVEVICGVSERRA